MRALGDQDRDPASPTYGCFDRRYWAWKIVDCPEATYQRHVYPLAMLVRDPASRFYNRSDVLEAIQAGVTFAIAVQHRNGSFDQAFPFEQSWGATAFLLHPLLTAFEVTKPLVGKDVDRISDRLAASAVFLRRERERHGTITNHLAGGALSLSCAGRALGDRASSDAAASLVAAIIASQSEEGWFPEYGGADPGYQSLCLYYLAEISRIAPSAPLAAAMTRAIEFLQWFVHPDGTFGGLYGSRRTRIAYPAGFALLAPESPRAASIAAALLAAAADEQTVTVTTIDAGNLAPLLTNVVRCLSAPLPASTPDLPRDRAGSCIDFPEAGLHVRSTARYYAVVGSGNGGTLTVFDRRDRTRMKDDGGYAGLLGDGRLVTSQVTAAARVAAGSSSITVDAQFSEMRRRAPSPWQFVLLRLLNLTVMRNIAVGNAVKRAIVARLMAPQARIPLSVSRTFVFGERIEIHDRLANPSGLRVQWMRAGVPFNAVHMASAGYYEGASLSAPVPAAIDIDAAQLSGSRTAEWSGEL